MIQTNLVNAEFAEELHHENQNTKMEIVKFIK
jgi:hypothetical protein